MKKFNHINMIPFIDILLVLLTIVLTTSTFIIQGKIKIDLPEARQVKQQHDLEKSFVIVIDAQGKVYREDKLISIETLDQELKTLSLDQSIVMKVDKKAPFQGFITVVDRLKDHGLEKLSIFANEVTGS